MKHDPSLLSVSLLFAAAVGMLLAGATLPATVFTAAFMGVSLLSLGQSRQLSVKVRADQR